ncbi:hypothetical protein V1264_010690 [Littorina saxatilis]|uniref:Uncharacterized protein n=1 Tax=Littorina saxatilis TaxID=31220 RepID=A0AAN9G0S4_9CAEN
MRLAFWFVIFLENYQLSHSQEVSSCASHLPDLSVNENAPVGEVILQMEVGPGESVEIDFNRQRNFYNTENTAVFSEAFHFIPADGSNQRRCTYQEDNATDEISICNITLATSLHPENIREQTGTSPADRDANSLILFYELTCYLSATLFYPLELLTTVEFTNEFSPVFKKALYTSTFHIINLLKGFHLLSLGSAATDDDVGLDGRVDYVASNGTDLIGVERTEVVLQRNITLEDVAEDTNLYFNLTACDRGDPKKCADTIFILKVFGLHEVQGEETKKEEKEEEDEEEEEEDEKEVIEADEDREVTTSKPDEVRTLTASRNDGKNITITNNGVKSSNLQILVGIAGSIAALLAACLLIWCCVTRKKDKKPEEPEKPKADPALPVTPGDLTPRNLSASISHEEVSSGGESVSENSES